MRLSTCLLAGLVAVATPAFAQQRPTTDAQIDYAGFSALTSDLEETRARHRLSWDEFAARARAEGAILLDARSESAYRRGHIKGAINLPFTDFTAESLRETLGADSQVPIFIYCNNNFSNDMAPVAMKMVELALNIPTFINLHGYGYGNVWELGDVVDFNDPTIGWVSAVAAANTRRNGG